MYGNIEVPVLVVWFVIAWNVGTILIVAFLAARFHSFADQERARWHRAARQWAERKKEDAGNIMRNRVQTMRVNYSQYRDYMRQVIRHMFMVARSLKVEEETHR